MRKIPHCPQDSSNIADYWAAKHGEQRKSVIEQHRLRRELEKHQRECPICVRRYYPNGVPVRRK